MIYAIVVVIVLIIDQAVKWWVVNSIDYGASMDFVPKLMELTHHHNTGMAFGLGSDIPWARWAFVALTMVFCGVIIYMLAKKIITGEAGRWLIVLVMAGGIGNCIDRAINGYVVDMFHFTFKIFGWDFPIFNVADIFVSVCGVAFCIWLIFHKSPEDEKDLAAGDPKRRRAEKERRKQREAQQKARERRAPEAHQDDYITQLKKPVGAARLELERERERARLAAEEEARAKAAKNQPRQQPQPRPRPEPRREPDLSDPFTDFIDKTEPMLREAAHSARPESKPVASAPLAPPVRQESRPAAAAAPGAPKKSDTDFTLEDILAEFSDQ